MGRSGTDEIPMHYRPQAVHLSIVTGSPVVAVPVLIGGSDYREYVLEPTEEQKEALVEALAEFWKLVETKTPPDEISTEYVRAIFPEDDGSEKVATPQDVELVQDYRRIRGVREGAEKTENELAARIQNAIGEAKKLVGPGFRISFSRSKDSERVRMEARRRGPREDHSGAGASPYVPDVRIAGGARRGGARVRPIHAYGGEGGE